MPRDCTCPVDGSSYCARCQAIASRAGITLPLPRGGELQPSSRRPRAESTTGPHTMTMPTEVQAAPTQGVYWPYRNKLEWRYAGLLAELQREAMIIRWRYEALRFKLGHRQTLTPDFVLTMPAHCPDNRMQCHDTKGFMRPDAWEKTKQAAKDYCEFRFFIVTYAQGHWSWQEIPPA